MMSMIRAAPQAASYKDLVTTFVAPDPRPIGIVPSASDCDDIGVELAGKVALITGSAGGIGFGIARACADAGMRVVLTDIDESVLGQARVALAVGGAKVMAVPLDVTDRDGWARVAEQVPAQMGPVQLLVNNAGVSTSGLAIDDVDPVLWDRVVAANLTGVYNGVHYFLPGLRAVGGGHIVNTSSLGGLAGFPLLGPYSATKAGVIALSETLRHELAPAGIGVSVLCPGAVRTRLWRTSRAVRGLPDTDTPPDDASGQSARAVMTPDEVGQRVLAGVRANQPYIFTTPDFFDVVEQRHRRLARGFAEAADFAG
jgi:NAD(P)-dependent dehydrogenase (short-subunit alcohol dehydrogenase family)